jgi:hypothetical protein
MLKSLGLRSETFGTAQEFLRSKRPDWPPPHSLQVVDENGGGAVVWGHACNLIS